MKRLAKTSIGVLGFALLASLAAPAPARAGHAVPDHHRHGGHRIHKGHGHDHPGRGWGAGGRHRRGPGPRAFAVPHHIDHHEVRTFQPYRWKRAYFRPHRHHHVLYRFPVWTPYGVAYRPYTYCDGVLFDAWTQGPRGGFGVSVSTPRFRVSYYDD